jgi:hypothetical protein
MKKSVLLIGLFICLVVVLSAGTLFAQQPGKPGKPVGETTSEQKKPPQKRLPDLTIDNIYLTKDCRVAVVVKNLGPGIVPDEVWTVHTPKSAGVYLYRNGTGWGGSSIWKFDPTKNLQRPVGTATYVSKLKVSGTQRIKAVVDHWDMVTEAREGNNSLELRLTCEDQTSSCCIAGTYRGVSMDDPACPVGPETGKFTLILKQTNCGSGVLGDVLDPATGAITAKLKAMVTPGPDKCCTLVGRVKGMIGTEDADCLHEVEATLCKNKLGKWYATDGTYDHISGSCCSGTFKIEQE